MAWCGTVDMPLPEPVMTQFTDEYICNTGPQRVNPDIAGLRIIGVQLVFTNIMSTDAIMSVGSKSSAGTVLMLS